MNQVGSLLIGLLVLGGSLSSCWTASQKHPSAQTTPSIQPSPLTWAQFVQQGGSPDIQTDYNLPIAFRNGPVYFNAQNNQITAFILKQGLSKYPPVQDGLIQLNYEYLPRLESRGEVIGLRWDLGDASKKDANDTSMRHPSQHIVCHRNVCLLSSRLSAAEKETILRSSHPIQTTAP